MRHGQTDWNAIGKIMGPQPIPLNETGRKQAESAALWMKSIPVDAVYSSPIRRAMETAEIAVRPQKNLKVIPEKGLSEIDYGHWVNRTFEEVKENFYDEWLAYREYPASIDIPGGESMPVVQKRAVAVVERMRNDHPKQNVLLVSHADVIKAVLIHYLEIPLDHLQKVGSENGSIAILRFGTTFGDRLIAMNVGPEATHLLRNVKA